MNVILAQMSAESESYPILFRVNEISQITGLDRRTIAELTRRGLTTPYIRMEGGRHVSVFPESTLETFLEAQALKAEGYTPRKILDALKPKDVTIRHDLLTETEISILEKFYPGKMNPNTEATLRGWGVPDDSSLFEKSPPPSAEVIGQELALSAEEVLALLDGATDKLVRAFLAKVGWAKPLTPALRASLILRKQKKDEELEAEKDLHPECPHCQTPGNFIKQIGSYTRVQNLYQCNQGHNFNIG